MKKLILTIALAVLALPFAANAKTAPVPGSVQAECAADVQSLCVGMNAHDQHQCLTANISKVSQSCGTALANARSASKEYERACNADIKQYCGNQPPGPAHGQCIVANEAQFSPACQNAMAARRAPGK